MSLHGRHSRRQFLARTVAAASTLQLASAVDPIGDRLDPQAIATLRARLKGVVILATDAGYDAARRIHFWNADTERRPALIARCAAADDVRHAVEFAHTHGLDLAVRGGGHSPMGWGVSNGLVIDLSAMTGVRVDPVGRTARVDAGVLGGAVTRAAGAYGLAPILGQCPGVGAAGVTLGGGLGWLSGLHGAACDNLVSARIVTADGRLLSVDAESNPNLLWALRGAGANFGVMVDFACRLHPIGPVTAGEIYYPVREARPVLRCFRDLMADAPDAFQATINLTRGERGVFISLCHAGEEAEAERLLRVLRAVATPGRDTVRRQAFADVAGTPATPPPDVPFRYIATLYRETISDDVIEVALDRVAEAPPETVLGLSHYEHGQVCRVAPDATAFPLRHTGGVHIRIAMEWNDAAAAKRLMTWTDDARRRLRVSSGERMYVNYQSHVESGSAEAVFGSNLPRLAALKKTYDPTNVFRRNSNVQP
jgi:FAD/FMN-containing dehydrogenase